MNKYGKIFSAFWLSVILTGISSFTSGPPVVGSFLAFNLMPGPNNSMVNFAIVTILPGGKKDVNFITQTEFVRLASGIMHSDVNPTAENFFSKYEVEECGFSRDSIFKKTYFFCSSLDQVWKLRYKTNPYGGGTDSLGWTGASVPSPGQMNILKQYGAENLDDYIYGENAFKLLHDVQSYAWQSRYRGS